MNSADILIAFFVIALCYGFIIVGYAQGFKDGRRVGYARGRAISRHVSNNETAVK